MKKHLENIAQILKDFVKENKFNRIQVSISGHVTARSHSKLGIDSKGDAIETLTLGEIRTLGKELHDKIRIYLEENNVEQSIKIGTTYEPEFGYTSGFAVSYETRFKISL